MKLNHYLYFLILTVFMLPESYPQDISYTDSLLNNLSMSQNRQDSLRSLIFLTWNQQGTNDEQAIRYGLMAEKLIKETYDSALIANAYDAAAIAYRLKGNKNKARELFQLSLEIGQRQNLPIRIAWANYNLESIALDENNIEIARMHADSAFRNFHRINNYNQAFKSYWLLINKNQKEYIDTLICAISELIPVIDNETDQIFYYLDLTNLYNLKGNRNKAMLNVQHAMELADRNKNIKGIVKAYSMIAFYFIDVQKNYAMALEYYNKALEILPEGNTLLKADLYINIGEMHRQLKNDNLALDFFNQALEIGQKFKHRHTMASAFMKIGEINYQNKNYSDARYYYTKSYETNCDVCPRIRFHQALVNIGHVNLLENEFNMAEKYYKKGLELADSSSDPRAKVISLQSYAKLYELQNNLQKAITCQLKALQIASENNNPEGKQESASSLSNLYLQTKDYAKAYTYLAEVNRLSDSINKRNEIENLAKLETYFDFKQLQAQKELEKTKAEEELNRQKFFSKLYISGALVIALFGILLYLGYRRKKQHTVVLSEQKSAIEKMSKKVHEADQLKLQFFTNISHEFKTPLTIILGMTEKLRNIISDSQPVELIRKNSLKLLQLVNHLLDLRMIDTMQMQLRVRKDNITEFAKGITGSFETLAQEKNITLRISSSKPVTSAFFDHDKLEKVLSNLLSNALKFTKINGEVEIILEESAEGMCRIEVRDNGIGISHKEMKNIFQRFYRVEQNGGQGTGIGLALVKELVEIHRGNIYVKENNTGGCIFIVEIPVQKHFYTSKEIISDRFESETHEYTNYVDINENKLNYTELNEPEGDKKVILIVEDNSDLRNYLTGLFIERFQILEAADGKKAYELAHTYIPDIIVSDIMMPQISGLQLVDMLKTNETTSHIPIILLTAKNDIGSRLSGFEKGADEYISKPFDSTILISRVDNLLRLRKQLSEKFSSQYRLQPREITIENADKIFLEKTIQIIEKHISDPNLNVDFLSLELGVSRTQLYRKLNALTEYPPKHFIRIIRLKRAAQILMHGQNNIAEVMDATGFSNYSYFNNSFKEFFGEYPKDYALIHVKGSLN